MVDRFSWAHVCMPSDRFDIPSLHRHLKTSRLGRRIEYADRLPSTSDYAMALARRGAPEGTAVLAEEQTAGRGRRGRGWHAPPGCGIWMSLILNPVRSGLELPALTLCAGAAVARALEEAAGVAPRIKWPNDVLIRDRKMAGILAEAQTTSQATVVVLGIGINVNHTPEDFPPSLRTTATSLRIETHRRHARQPLLQALLESLDAYYFKFLRTGLSVILPEVRSRLAWIGDRVYGLDGPTPVSGVIVDLGDDGSLLIETPDHERIAIRSGTVQRRPRPPSPEK